MFIDARELPGGGQVKAVLIALGKEILRETAKEVAKDLLKKHGARVWKRLTSGVVTIKFPKRSGEE